LHIFHPLAEKPPWSDLHKIFHEGSPSQRNQPCQILSESDQGFWFCWVEFLAFP